MNQPYMVSIIINNYNYGRYLGQAIESALRQKHQPLEVIVVDDGSTDDSQSIIASYARSIIPILKPNGGQASALNAGYACSQGEVIIFLDADDVLLPGVAQRTAKIFQTRPETAKVQYRLETINEAGERTGKVNPPWGQKMPDGDLRRRVLTHPDDIPWQPTSGAAFRSQVLERIFPIPEKFYRICADYYLSNLTPLLGEITSLEETGALYRIHSANNQHTSKLDIDQTRQIILRTYHTHRFIKMFAEANNITGFPANAAEVHSVTFLAHRMISIKLDPGSHPLKGDRPVNLFKSGVRASFGRFDLPWRARTLQALWFGSALLAPKAGVRWLAQKFFFPESRGRWDSIIRFSKERGEGKGRARPALPLSGTKR